MDDVRLSHLNKDYLLTYDLESVSRDAHLAVTVSTKFEVDTTIRCLVIALLLLIRYVTL